MTVPSIIRFNSSAATVPWSALPEESLAEGDGRRRGALFFESPGDGVSAGLLETAAHVSRFRPGRGHALYLLLSGSVTFQERDHVTQLKPGDAVIVPDAVPFVWRQASACRFFMIALSGPASPPLAPPVTLMRIHRKISLSPLRPLPRAVVTTDIPTQRARVYFETASGDMRAGVWESTGYSRRALPHRQHEFVHLISGEVTLTDAEGAAHTFSAGDTFLIRRGASVAWTQHTLLRKIFACVGPPQSLMS